jgi:hypothetical protein
MKLTHSLIAAAILAGISATAFAGPGAQFWQKQPQQAAAKTVVCKCQMNCCQAKS